MPPVIILPPKQSWLRHAGRTSQQHRARIGTRSLRLGFDGALAGAVPVYAGHLVLAFIDRETMRSTPIPSFVRDAIERYAGACARDGGRPGD